MEYEDIYSFDTVGGLSVVVEPTSQSRYEGTLYERDYHKPIAVIEGKDPEDIRNILIKNAGIFYADNYEGETE